ncbi:hypothetical protein CAPN008_20740 [Capnocytophaga canis]|uniref:hypothetical protein n=1 Tax=Capnocytophaga canis TaxID=1848903 RepID=UPI001AC7BD45|nr:hypothetical protein [Capnocytophaga canis]GIM62024.1 hypothetical protein CAPN008_20740 [Capnocytophaga canis]
MSTTAKKTTKKKTALAGAVKTNKEEIFYDENGKRISRTGYFMRKIKAEGGGVRIMDMRAVLK